MCVFGRYFFVTRTVEVFGRDFLSGRAVQVFEVGFGDLGVTFFVGIFVDDRHGRFGQNRQRRHHDVELVSAAVFFQCQERFVFPRQQHVTLPVVHKGDG